MKIFTYENMKIFTKKRLLSMLPNIFLDFGNGGKKVKESEKFTYFFSLQV